MNFEDLINLLPLWAVFWLTFAVCVGAVEVGAAFARHKVRHKQEQEPEAPMGSLVGAVLGLLAFMLAFTFGLAGSRFDARRHLVLAESNAIGTTYLRAGLLPQTQSVEIRRLLREYGEVRLNFTGEKLPQVITTSEAIHRQLWSQAKSLLQTDMDSELRGLFLSSLNELIDLHQSRKTVGVQYRIPGTIWFAVYLLSILSMLTFGYQIGMHGRRRLRATPVMVAAFSMVMVLIADLDRPAAGFLRVSQQPIVDVLEMMSQESP